MRHSAPLAAEREFAGPALAAVTLGELLASLPDGVDVLHDAGQSDAPLRWVEASELADPTPYLLEGEFVLTAGLPLIDNGGSQAHVASYVSRLVSAGVQALGFGLKPYFETVPELLETECRAQGLTLVAVSHTVPFNAIGLAFSTLLESGNARVFRHLADTNRLLMRAVLSPRPDHELLAALATRVPVWAVLVGADGKVRSRAAATAVDVGSPADADLQDLIGRLLGGTGPRVETQHPATGGNATILGHPLRSSRDATLGALIIGSTQQLTAAHNSVISSVVGLLELLVRQRTSGALAPSQLATTLLLRPDTLQSHSGRDVLLRRELVAQSVSGTRTSPLRVVQGIRLPQPMGAVQAARASPAEPVREILQWRRLLDTKLVELTEHGFSAITRLKVDEPLMATIEGLGWGLVVGEATDVEGLQDAYQRTCALRSQVRSSGRSVRLDATNWSIVGLLGTSAGEVLARRLLGPILDLEQERRTAHLVLLRSWLAENGSWDATAKVLGLHRNSVRRQINAVAELLGCDLGQAQARAELLIALQFVPAVASGEA
ncbi:PucR family transcriptional regulator [Pseudarthrobacter sp. PS3-L1]|uniref:PucR family transcriptional regulator n=1 Tax=Pseudarthrobacter sp. PS3-L1 TaxID=3046207 RepID=UPI0024BB9302|nr:PucR family transcriptional regulator [Pseudarthrobacter sp. PS3-L1]MDJ0319557.1 PucR family transcriptional regulator ligand-binding domain-containing protein [Pseudarthrobacter sp. PS3-L1]